MLLPGNVPWQMLPQILQGLNTPGPNAHIVCCSQTQSNWLTTAQAP